ncbi:MAG: amidohydrolase family protein [Lewinellaceae bacterium]|nr:amidohydrolase family protein [Lewinellaceae bacterium]
MQHFVLRLLFFAFCAAPVALFAQQTYPQAAPSDQRDRAGAFTNATIFVDYQTRLDSATLIVRKGKVVACGKNVAVPKDAVVVNCSGKTIYPGLIDLYATGYGLGAQRTESRPPGQQAPQPYSNKKGAYSWNEALRPEFSAAEAFSNDEKAAAEWRKLGFGALLTHQADGISRGTGALVALADEREHETILLPRATHHLSLRKGSSTQNYPSSLMGVLALIRQTYLDADWYKTAGHQEEQNLSLEAWNSLQDLPQIFEAADKLDVLRIARVGQEFGKKYVVKTTGDEYQRLAEIKATGQVLIVPLEFPDADAAANPFDALNVSLSTLKHWEMAPSNPARLAAAGIPFALTANDLRDKKQFWTNLRKAVENGLSEQDALRALTWQPARLINAYDQIGSLEPGKVANFFITSGNVFKADTKILDTWVQGKKYTVTTDNLDGVNLLGVYQLRVDTGTLTLTVKGKTEAPEAELLFADSSTRKANISYGNGLVLLTFQPDTTGKAFVSLSGEVRADGNWSGRGTRTDGSWTAWSAQRTGDAPADKPKRPEKTPAAPETGDMIYPFTAFGQKEKPKAATYLIRNTTVWTNEREGILRNVDVLVSNGKIQRIGRSLPVQDDAEVVDGRNKHLTAGIIDEHSHIAVARSVNEGTQESSAEVRIADALDSEDINIYRQLSGGVTSSHLLHGSANPIGGQSQLIKLRWGAAPEELKFQNWPGQIKFALGENVKQSNWGDNNRTRYPQTRMGVEQVYVDYFTRAQEYARLKKSGKPYRKDLEMEALQEILESKRFITCHSYVQSEITMLMRVAEKFGFRINTFTHILEGYKVADKMATHGVGGSTFSDWWAYKFEVYQAIPYNAAIMHKQGVTVAINSDDAEMARRLNQEAGKTVMYGGVSEEDAWKMVTLNPAKLLRVDDRVGSVKAGKDADLVLWNDNPLSVYARAEKTWVDGIQYFDREEDKKRQEWVRKERARILSKMQADKKPGGGGERPAQRPREHYHCDSMEDEG